MKKDIFLLLGIMGMLSCSDHKDLYNPDNEIERKQEEYDKNFPVKDIDPEQDWNTFTSVKVKVTVNEDMGETYTVKLYTDNPLDENSNALLLAKGEIKNGGTYSEEVQVSLSTTCLWVVRVDAHHRRLVKLVAIQDGSVECVFGGVTGTRSISRAAGDNNGITVMEDPYTSAQIQNFLKDAVPLTDGTALQENVIYKVTDKFAGTFTHAGAELDTKTSVVKLIVWGEGAELTLINRINAGLEVIVGNGGKLLLPDSGCNFVQTAQLTVLGGGTVSGSALTFTNGSTNFNAGTLEIGILNNNGGTLYNKGTMKLSEFQGPSTNSKFINNGAFTSTDITGAGVNIETGCLLKATNSITVNELTIGSNAAVETKEMHLNGVLTLMPVSLLNVADFYLNNGTVIGPLTASSTATSGYTDYGFLKINTIKQWNYASGNGYIAGHVVSEVEKCENYDGQNTKWNYENGGLLGTYTGISDDLRKHTDIVISKAHEAPIVIPEGDCTGDGYTPEPDGGDDDDDEQNSAIYAFEDLGSIGDYDFNDVVVKVEHLAGSKTATVKLLAVGGTFPVKLKYGNQTLWEEAHAAFGVDTNTMVNTGGARKDVPSALDIDVSENVAFRDISISIEVILSSGTTSKSVIISSPDKGEVPQMLCVPGVWKWPNERVGIIEAYGTTEHSFGDWAGDVKQATDWYDYPVEGKVYK